MNKGISYYTKYREHITEYNDWNSKKSGVPSSSFSENTDYLKQKAKAIAEPILLLDSYTHEKAEDAETFYQTYNTELMSVTSLVCAFPLLLNKASTDVGSICNTLLKHSNARSFSPKYTK